MNKIVGHKAFNAEQIMLDASFTRLNTLFTEYQSAINQRIHHLEEELASLEKETEEMQNRHVELVDSLKEMNVLPDDHQWSQHVKQMKQEINQLLTEVHSFIEYAEEKRNVYFK